MHRVICFVLGLKGNQGHEEYRHYVSGLCGIERAAKAIRGHWAIENQWHWILDMSFGKDASCIRKKAMPPNIAVIRHAVLNVIQQIKPKRQSVNQFRKLAG